MLGFLKDYCCVMINIEIKPGTIVEPFDQKDGPDEGERQAKIFGVQTQPTLPAMGQKISIENGAIKHGENFLPSGKRS